MADNKTDPRLKSAQNPVYYIPENSPVAPQRFDTRVRLQYGSRGFVSKKDLEAYHAQLPDDSAHAEYRPLDVVLGDDNANSDADEPNTAAH